MKKEFITIREKETTIRVLNTKVNAVRMKDIVKKGVRVYENGKIGISGAIGDVPDDVLLENAKLDLNTGIEYPYELSSSLKDHRDYTEKPVDGTELLEIAEKILEKLRIEYPDFDFGEAISTTELTYQMKNSEGLDLEYRDSFMALGLILKENKSANLFDGFLQYFGRSFDMDKFWAFNHDVLSALSNPVPLAEGEVLPVFTFELETLKGFLNRSLNGERYATGSSIFSGKLGERLFNEKVTLEQNRSPLYEPQPFFDKEGIVLEDDRCALIDKGRLVNVFTDKKTASQYNLPHTGAASGAYDDMPALNEAPLGFAIDSHGIKAALNGEMAVLAAVSSGGDFTADGSYAAPVQLAFLFDGERIVGKLPEFTMRSHLYKMLGEDYIGTFDNECFYFGDGVLIQGYNMTIVR